MEIWRDKEDMRNSALILAPHPDDECITGLLPLRLQEECGYEIRVVPFSLGSRMERRKARAAELRAACKSLGFRLCMRMDADADRMEIGNLAQLLAEWRPTVVLLPHAQDGHATHRATHIAGVAAMDAVGGDFNVVETEYWHPLRRPNLMVAATRHYLSRLRRALACHQGEVARNDYAARLPAWMSDNVRRGGELVGGAGAAAPDLAHATLYRARRRAEGRWTLVFKGGWIIDAEEDLAALADGWNH